MQVETDIFFCIVMYNPSNDEYQSIIRLKKEVWHFTGKMYDILI